MPYYTADQPLSIENWNSLIRDLNDILANPPEESDCDPIAPLPEVADPHLWLVEDVEAVRNKLIETCPDITFEAALELWTYEILDEIEAAMSQAWCNCEAEDLEATFGPIQFNWTELEASYDPVKCSGYIDTQGSAVSCPGMPALEDRYDSPFYPCPNNAGQLATMASNYTVAQVNTSAYRQTVNRLLVLADHISTVQTQIDSDAAVVDSLIASYASCSGNTCETIAASICVYGHRARAHQDTLDAYMDEFLDTYPDMADQKLAADTAAAANWGAALALAPRFPTGVNMITHGASFYTYPWAEWLRPEYDESISPLIPSASITRLIYRISPSPLILTFQRPVYISPGGFPYMNSGFAKNFVLDLVRPYLWRPTRWVCDRLSGPCSDGTPPCTWGPWRDDQAYRPWYQICNDDGSLGYVWCPIAPWEDVQATLQPYGVQGSVKYPSGRKNHDYTDEQTEFWNRYLNWYSVHPQYDDRHSGYC